MKTEKCIPGKCAAMVLLLLAGLSLHSTIVLGQEDNIKSDFEILNKTFLGNDCRNYYGKSAPDALHIIWKHYLGEGTTVISRKLGSRDWKGAGWTGQPLMIREKKDTFLIQGAYDHHLKKINTRDGTLIWEYAFDDVIKGTGSVWVNNQARNDTNRIIILQGSRLGIHHFLDADSIFSYRAISYHTGEELWRHNVKMTDSYSRDVDASALIINDTAYIGLENSLFTVFDPSPAQARKVNNHFEPLILKQHLLYGKEDVIAHKNNVVTESSPARIGRMIYITSGAGHVWGYDMDLKELTWKFTIGSDMDGSPVVTKDSCLLVTIEKQYIKGPGGLLKVDPSSPPEEAVKWFLPTGNTEYVSWEGGIIGSAATSDQYNNQGLAACMAMDGYLYVVKHNKLSDSTTVSYDSTGVFPVPEIVFKYEIGPSISTPLFTEDKLIACGYEGIYLFGYNEENHFQLIEHLNFEIEATPFIMNKRIYIASRNGFLYCLGN